VRIYELTDSLCFVFTNRLLSLLRITSIKEIRRTRIKGEKEKTKSAPIVFEEYDAYIDGSKRISTKR